MPRYVLALMVAWTLTGCVQSPSKAGFYLVDAGDDADDSAGGGPGATVCPEPVVDGRFTGVMDAGIDGENEYRCGGSLKGVYGRLYVSPSLNREKLFFLNDWYLKTDGPIPNACYNLFSINAASHLVQVRVFGDQHVEVLVDGEPVEIGAEGATTWDVSPASPTKKHTIFEFSLPLEGFTYWEMEEADPGSSASKHDWECDEDDELVEEPTIFKGTINPSGSVGVEGDASAPFVKGVSDWTVDVGQTIVFTGTRLGSSEGAAWFGAARATVVTWADDRVVVTVPGGVNGPVPTRLVTSNGATAPLILRVACTPACDGRDCGPDACGGSCGACAADRSCLDGLCTCLPACDGKVCGADGCGGVCGICDPGWKCQDDHCACVPKCSNRECGDDNCGGSCGSCADASVCEAGQCVCVPDCVEKQCGDDTCGGSCGTCPAGQECAKNFQCMTP